LVHGAAGGFGHLAVQVAKALGAYVIGTARAAKHDFVRGLGADEMIDYTRVDFADAVRDVDVVLDTIGGDYGTRSLRPIRTGGTLVTLTSPGDVPPAEQTRPLGIRTGFTLVEPDYTAAPARSSSPSRERRAHSVAARLRISTAWAARPNAR
jgi:NADPH:quinone reductase-like Zn-dependent oxidoreductase